MAPSPKKGPFTSLLGGQTFRGLTPLNVLPLELDLQAGGAIFDPDSLGNYLGPVNQPDQLIVY